MLPNFLPLRVFAVCRTELVWELWELKISDEAENNFVAAAVVVVAILNVVVDGAAAAVVDGAAVVVVDVAAAVLV